MHSGSTSASSPSVAKAPRSGPGSSAPAAGNCKPFVSDVSSAGSLHLTVRNLGEKSSFPGLEPVWINYQFLQPRRPPPSVRDVTVFQMASFQVLLPGHRDLLEIGWERRSTWGTRVTFPGVHRAVLSAITPTREPYRCAQGSDMYRPLRSDVHYRSLRHSSVTMESNLPGLLKGHCKASRERPSARNPHVPSSCGWGYPSYDHS